MANVHPAGHKTKANVARSQCQPAGDVVLPKGRPSQGFITAPQLGVESAFHSGNTGPATRPRRQASSRPPRRWAWGAPPTLRRGRGPWGRGSRGGGGGSLAKLPAEEVPEASAATGRDSEAAPRGDWPEREGADAELRGRGCGGRAGRPGCAAKAGRRRPSLPGLTKRKQPRLSACSPSRPGPPKGAGGGCAETLRVVRQGRGTSCLGPRPGPIPECFEAADLEDFPAGSEPSPRLSYSPRSAVRSAAACGSSLLSWDEAPRPP